VERSFLSWQESQGTTLAPEQQKTLPEIQQTLNRVSDYLYLLRCWCNAQSQIKEKEFRTKKK
jgi:cob(I)alamin adenosyltransferase